MMMMMKKTRKKKPKANRTRSLEQKPPIPRQ
jgi:hypothetical protein